MKQDLMYVDMMFLVIKVITGSLGCSMYSFPKLFNKITWIMPKITQITHCANFQGLMEVSLVTLTPSILVCHMNKKTSYEYQSI